jgi:hypothetical protein
MKYQRNQQPQGNSLPDLSAQGGTQGQQQGSTRAHIDQQFDGTKQRRPVIANENQCDQLNEHKSQNAIDNPAAAEKANHSWLTARGLTARGLFALAQPPVA